MYTAFNYKTKKDLKKDVELLKNSTDQSEIRILSRRLTVYQPNNITDFSGPYQGHVTLEGPHWPDAHRWYASAIVKDSIIQSVE